jgi:hypothetical protein
LEILITEEQLSELLTEAIEDYLYYYRSPDSLVDILTTNKIKSSVVGLGISKSSKDTLFSKNRLFFLSTSRNKNFVFKNKACRIYLDKNKLKRKYKIVPFNYFYGSESRLDSSEFEDRILMDEPYLVASSYIKRIDIFGSIYDLGHIIKLSQSYNIPIYFFNNFEQYRIGNEKYANKFLKNSSKIENDNKEIYKLNNENLKLFSSIFYFGDIKTPFLNNIDENYMKNKKDLFLYHPTAYYKDFIDLIDKVRSNPEYFEYLKFLAKKMRYYAAKDIKIFIKKIRSKLIIKEYISNGSTGDLYLRASFLETLSPLEKVDGNLDVMFSKDLKTFGTLKEAGFVSASESEYLITLGRLTTVTFGVNLSNCKSLRDLGLLESVGGYLDLRNCISLKSLGNLKEVKQSIYLNNCTSLKDFGNLKEVGDGEYIYLVGSGLEKEYRSGELQKKYPHLADKFKI